MLRSSLLLALLTLPALAQRTPSGSLADPIARASIQEVDLDSVLIRVDGEGTNALGLQGGQIDPTSVAIVMERDFLTAVRGNLDRESLERANGESR